jgi:hypothetical protein
MGTLYKRSLILSLQNQVPNEIIIAEDAALLYPAIYNSNAIYVSAIAACNYPQRPNSILKSTNFDNKETSRIATAFHYMAETLKSRNSKFDFEKQFQAYFVAIVTIQAGGFFWEVLSFTTSSKFLVKYHLALA